MDMTCYTVEKREDAEKVDIKLAFALATAHNVSPAVMHTVVKKLVGCVETELTGLDWSGTKACEGGGDMKQYLLGKVKTGVE